ncbi:MAG: endonuclease III [Bacilli bacterium]|nr:endonuclease III [Bacilli bacterium]MBN2877717.1 endonuclease III [Bacilli bacterium]
MGTTVDIPMFIFDEISKLYPQARCELNYRKDYELLIAIMLSAQTTDQAVNAVTERLFEQYHSVQEFAEAPLADLEHAIRRIGLFRNKTKNVKTMASIIVEQYQGKIPADQSALESLPGVGRKTANVYLAEFHHVPRIAVDTHVSRVSIRLGFAKQGDSPETIEKKLMKLYDESLWINLHHKLIFFGRYFCKAKKPNCKECPILQYCKMPVL